MRYVWIPLITAALVIVGGCSRNKPDKPQRPLIITSIEPLAYFVERIADDGEDKKIDIDVLVPAGMDPHSFEPRPKQMAALTGATLLFRTGMVFEEAITAKLADTQSRIRIVNVSAGIEQPADHDDGQDDGDHHAHGIDPHVWMSPRAAKKISQTICDELCAALPTSADDFRGNLKELLADLDRLDEQLTATLAPLKGSTFYVFHPAFGHFAHAYGLKQRAVEIDGKAPQAKQLQQLIDQARAEGVKMIFVQPQFSPASAKTIAAQIGAKVIPLDPLARDYIRDMHIIADTLAAPRQ